MTRLNYDGTLDTSFGTNGEVLTDVSGGGDDTVRAMAGQDDSRLALVGSSRDAAGNTDVAVAVYNGNGAPVAPGFIDHEPTGEGSGSGYDAGLGIEILTSHVRVIGVTGGADELTGRAFGREYEFAGYGVPTSCVAPRALGHSVARADGVLPSHFVLVGGSDQGTFVLACHAHEFYGMSLNTSFGPSDGAGSHTGYVVLPGGTVETPAALGQFGHLARQAEPGDVWTQEKLDYAGNITSTVAITPPGEAQLLGVADPDATTLVGVGTTGPVVAHIQGAAPDAAFGPGGTITGLPTGSAVSIAGAVQTSPDEKVLVPSLIDGRLTVTRLIGHDGPAQRPPNLRVQTGDGKVRLLWDPVWGVDHYEACASEGTTPPPTNCTPAKRTPGQDLYFYAPNGVDRAYSVFTVMWTGRRSTPVTVVAHAAIRTELILEGHGYPVRVVYGHGATLTGLLRRDDNKVPLASLPVGVWQRQARAWVKLAGANSDANGRVSIPVYPKQGGEMELRYAGSPTIQPSVSFSKRWAYVTPVVTGTLSETAVPWNSSARFYGTTRPARAGARIYLEMGDENGHYSEIPSATTVDKDGRYSITVHCSDLHYDRVLLRAVLPSNSLYQPARSPARWFNCYQAGFLKMHATSPEWVEIANLSWGGPMNLSWLRLASASTGLSIALPVCTIPARHYVHLYIGGSGPDGLHTSPMFADTHDTVSLRGAGGRLADIRTY
jgi:hypothetical protein